MSAGNAEGGEMQYALGTETEATQPYTTSIPTGIEAGTYYVWYKVVGDANHNDVAPARVKVTIGSIAVTDVTLNTTTGTMTVGDVQKLTAEVLPSDATDKKVKWSVGGTNADAVKLYSDKSCAAGTEIGTTATATLTVYAKAISAGTATVTVTSNANETKTASSKVKVYKPAPEVNITTQPKDVTLTYGYADAQTLTVAVEEIDGYDLTYQWFTSEDKSGSVVAEIEGATASSYTIPMDLNAGV